MVQKCQIEPFFQATLWQKSSALEKERVGNERVEEEKIQEENVVDGEFGLWRGKKAKNGSNPGKLIVGMKERFLSSRKIGNHLHFHCAKKETLNCEMKARLLDDHGKLALTELGCIPHICHGRHGRRPCKFFWASVNFYRFNAKNWHFSV